MFSLAKIVLPVDFSERSLGAARYVEVLAGRFGSEVILLHVLPPPHYEFSALEVGGTMLNELFAARSAQLRSELDAFQEPELAHIRTRRLLLEGDPAKKIVEFAQNEKAGVIVMPTHGYGPFRRFILGSVTAKVLHDADCPVWTGVHLEQAPEVSAIRFDRILAGLDLGHAEPQDASLGRRHGGAVRRPADHCACGGLRRDTRGRAGRGRLGAADHGKGAG